MLRLLLCFMISNTLLRRLKIKRSEGNGDESPLGKFFLDCTRSGKFCHSELAEACHSTGESEPCHVTSIAKAHAKRMVVKKNGKLTAWDSARHCKTTAKFAFEWTSVSPDQVYHPNGQADPLHLDCPDPNNLEALDLLQISILKRSRSFEFVDGDTATALFHVLKPHGASICGAGADIHGCICMKTGIYLKQLQAQEETFSDLVCLDPRGAIFKPRDIANGLAMVFASDGKLNQTMLKGRWHHRLSWMADAAQQHRLNVE